MVLGNGVKNEGMEGKLHQFWKKIRLAWWQTYLAHQVGRCVSAAAGVQPSSGRTELGVGAGRRRRTAAGGRAAVQRRPEDADSALRRRPATGPEGAGRRRGSDSSEDSSESPPRRRRRQLIPMK